MMSYGTPNTDYIRGWRQRTDDTRPMWALNLMRYHPVAQYPDGRQTTLSGWEADDLYSPQEELGRVGALGALRAPVVHQLVGDGARWDRVAIAKYPTRVSQLDMQRLPEFQERHIHKIAGMDFTIVLATFRPDGAPPAPPRLGEAPMLLVQVVADRNAPDYAEGLDATPVAVFDVEDTIIGDSRKYAQSRIHMLSATVGDQLKSRRRVDSADSYVLLVEIERNLLVEALGS
ncbi:hypothetical protein [Phenylobacterium sp. SCN 70-31]|uniref:hypothetical protein n=1 Tax=Phenylobacterium sp. SCN 70-31 TaxID=1660129 RepID=UPI00086A211A|nr:hypothetical protein [Phenylobacterium sp. SCN 70-31]ODT89411.1 MAG: hypothetical protein ABS78_04320 [Phenylobacterium sp. SCN 70-31]